MPNFDSTGPAGTGELTGRGMGKCPGAGMGRCGQRRGRLQSEGCRRGLSLEEQEKNFEKKLALVRATIKETKKSE